VTSSDESALVVLSAKANFRKLGPLLGAGMNRLAEEISKLGPAQLETVLRGGTVTVAGRELGGDDMFIERTARTDTLVETGAGLAVALDTRISDELLLEGVARELISRVQRLRRDAGLDVSDRITVTWSSEDPEVRAAISAHGSLIASEVLAERVEESSSPLDDQIEVDNRPVGLSVTVV
jgi:isoleucyl-tRNA synthetase